MWFMVSHGCVTDVIDRVKKLFLKNVVPYHLGFGMEHNLTLATIREELSTWMSRAIGKEVFGHEVLAVADGTYIYCMSLGSFEGNKALYSGHKKRHLLKVSSFSSFENCV